MMDNIYAYDESLMLKIREEKAWLNDPKYFKRIKISPSACVKMISHGQSGVEKGIKKGGKPIEIMGMLVGRPDTEDRNCMIISDAQPLPIEGFETRVVADDESVINYMIELGESNEITKKDRFCGWYELFISQFYYIFKDNFIRYHTHPFDVDIHSQCFMSSTDISTQLQWQRAEDPFGNPWIAIVIDPLRSIANEKPELAAFRVYPPEYTAPANETPNGEIVTNDKFRIERWGAVWNRYYQLEMQFYMSSLTQSVIGVLKNKFSWKESISSTPSNEKGL